MTSRLPTADDVAVAIVAACRATKGEDTLLERATLVASRATGKQEARHYALHALHKVFPDCKPEKLAEYVGAPGKPETYWRNSCHNVANPVGLSAYETHWWRREVWERVTLAIEAARTARAVRSSIEAATGVELEPPLKTWPMTLEEAERLGDRRACEKGLPPPYRPPEAPKKLGRLEVGGYRPPPGTIADVIADDVDGDGDVPIFDRGNFRDRKPPAQHAGGSKAEMARILAEAAANTAREQGVMKESE